MNKRLGILICCALFTLVLPIAARADSYVVTNDITAITNSSPSLSFDNQQAGRYKIYSRIGGIALPLSLTSNYLVRWYWKDTRVGEVIRTYNGTVVNGINGEVFVDADLKTLDVGTNYEAEVWAILNGVKVHRVAWNTMAVTSSAISYSYFPGMTVMVAGSTFVFTNFNSSTNLFQFNITTTNIINNNTVVTNNWTLQLDNITQTITYSSNFYFSGLGELDVYTNNPASPVTIDPANGWDQVLYPTGTTLYGYKPKSSAAKDGSIRLTIWGTNCTATNAINSTSIVINAGGPTTILSDNPAGLGVTNWRQTQIYP